MNREQNIDKFPGYPHYPASEDIERAANNNGKKPYTEGGGKPQVTKDGTDNSSKTTAALSGTDADITEEDIRTLDAAEQNMESTEGSDLQHASLDSVDNDGDPLNEESSGGYDISGENLDVPGASDDDADELIGEEDEENNYYSLGGDNHESQEESKD